MHIKLRELRRDLEQNNINAKADPLKTKLITKDMKGIKHKTRAWCTLYAGWHFFFIPMAFIQIEQLTKLFLYFSINIQLQSCYTYIPTIQQVVHSCYGCQKSSMHNCYTSVIMAMMIILKPPELIHTVTAPKTCSNSMFYFSLLY